jgi:hypothetical protein
MVHKLIILFSGTEVFNWNKGYVLNFDVKITLRKFCNYYNFSIFYVASFVPLKHSVNEELINSLFNYSHKSLIECFLKEKVWRLSPINRHISPNRSNFIWYCVWLNMGKYILVYILTSHASFNVWKALGYNVSIPIFAFLIIIIIIIIISVVELGQLLTRCGLTYPEVSLNVCHDSLCQLGNNVSLPWVIYYEAFSLHVVSSILYIYIYIYIYIYVCVCLKGAT